MSKSTIIVTAVVLEIVMITLVSLGAIAVNLSPVFTMFISMTLSYGIIFWAMMKWMDA